MKVRTRIVGLAGFAAIMFTLGGCGFTVSRTDYLNTAFGPGPVPETYRVGGVAQGSTSGSRVTLIRSAGSSSSSAPAATAPASN